MEYIREVVEGKELAKVVKVPVRFKKNKVEIIVYEYNEDINNKKKATKKAAGILAKYANHDLREMEKDAWRKAVKNQ